MEKKNLKLLYKSLCDSVSLWLNSYIFYSVFCLLSSVNGYCLTIEPFLPKIGEKVSIFGEGYKPNEEITLNLEKRSFKAKATSFGTFTTTFFIQSQPGGQKSIRAKSKSKEETISFWIRPVMKAYPLRGSRGTKVFIYGNGYPSGERTQVGMGLNSHVTFVDVGEGGTFSSSFIIGNLPYGSNTFFTLGRVTFMDEKMAFFMEPELKVMPQSGMVGSIVTLSGTGYELPKKYEPGEFVRIDFGAYISIACVRSDKFGSFELPITVPIEPAGKSLVQANGISSSVKGKTFFEIVPRIKTFPLSCNPTRPIIIEVDGFSRNETITLTLEKGREGTMTLIQKKEFFADENGAFKFDFLVDTQAKGIKRITIKGEFRFMEVRNIEIKPCIEVFEIDRKGSTLTLKGVGFMENEEVSFSFGGPRHIGKTMADKEGSFLATFKVYGIGEKERIIAEGMKSCEITTIHWTEKNN